MSKEIHSKAAPFIQWLKEAEEESSEDDDEANSDAEVEVIWALFLYCTPAFSGFYPPQIWNQNWAQLPPTFGLKYLSACYGSFPSLGRIFVNGVD